MVPVRKLGEERNERPEGAKLTVTQWIHITTLIVTALAGGGFWIAHDGTPSSPEFTETRSQLNDLTNQVVRMQLEQQHMKDQIEYLEEVIKRTNK